MLVVVLDFEDSPNSKILKTYPVDISTPAPVVFCDATLDVEIVGLTVVELETLPTSVAKDLLK
jgi:hypothetical protein